MKRRFECLFAVLMLLLIVSLHVVHAAELSLTYDANGNLISGDGKYRVYNSMNQLTTVYNGSSDAGVLLEEFWHDPLEERISVKRAYNTNGSVKETVYYVTKEFVRIVNNSGTYDFTYVHHNGEVIAQVNPDGSKLFMHADHQGNIVAVTNASGTVIENTTYSPYQEVLSGGTRSRYSGEGKEYDSVVGDYDFNFRKYNPSWGIFLTPDDTLQNVYDPQLLNRYSFERSNPYKYTDPDGHWALTFDVGATMGIMHLIGTSVGVGVSYSEEYGLQAGFVGTEQNGWGWFGSAEVSPITLSWTPKAQKFDDLFGPSNTRGGSLAWTAYGLSYDKSESKGITTHSLAWSPGFSLDVHELASDSGGGYVQIIPGTTTTKNTAVRSSGSSGGGGSGKVTVSIDFKKGQATGGKIGTIGMSAGFAAKAAQALGMSSKSSTPSGSTSRTR